jgi:trimeric autotransporter adhesin
MKKKFTLNSKIKLFATALLLVLSAGIKNTYAQVVPNITYNSPQVYTAGTAIATLTPTNTGGAVYPANYGAPANFANVNAPYGVATDAANNVYAVNEISGDVYKYNAAGTNTLIINTPSIATAIAIDGLGNIYISEFSNHVVLKYNAAGTLLNTIAGINAPYGIAIDALNNAYVADSGTGNIIEIAAGTAVISTFLSGFTTPYGVTIDPSGNMFVSQTNLNNIIKIPSGTGNKITFYSAGLNAPRGLNKDAFGNIYVADYGNNAVKRISNTGALTLSITTGVNQPRKVAFDASGNMFEADFGTNTIQKLSATTYSISAALPVGLIFNTTTGQITGTPTTPIATTTYTITAYNTGGSATTPLTITVTGATLGNYAFQKLITLNNAAIGMAGNQSNFPALVSIQDNALIINGTCADAVQTPNGPNYDFAFLDPSSATELNYQVESYNQATGTLLVWVKIPTLFAATNNNLTFYFGSLAPPTTHNAAFFNATWANDYQAVYHFNEAAYTGTVIDGTANGHTGNTGGMTAADLVAGKIGNAYTFNGSSKKITANPVTVTGPFTISAWINLNAVSIDQKVMTNQGPTGSASGGYKLGVYSTNIPEAESGAAITRGAGINSAALTTGAWYYVQGVFSGTTLSTYINGVQYNIFNTTNAPTSITNFYIGVGEGGTNYYFNGIIDEPRVSNVAKSSDWIKAEYADQNNPVTFTNSAAAASTTVANAAAIPGALTYTWTGATSTNPTVATNWNNTTAGTVNQLPAFTGPATLVIPAGLANYPSLTANASIYGLTIATGAKLDLNGFTLSVGCNIYNTNTGTINWNNNTASAITWNGSSVAQSYNGSVTAATAQLGSMTLNNTVAGTLTINSGPLYIYNQLTIIKGNLVVGAAPAALTLKSTAVLTASVNAIPAGYSITGTINAERYITGGAGHRGYRLLSSPVYAATVNLNNVYSLNYLVNLANGVYLTGIAGGGFDKPGNPTLYLYREDITPSNATFTSGNFWGISAINNVPSYNYYLNGGATVYNIPAGNGYMLFFRGNRSSAAVGVETTAAYTVPVTVTLSTSGTLNQGQVVVHNWYNPGSANIGYTGAGVGTNFAVRGFNLVGNPYPSSIDWSKFSNAAPGSPIYGQDVNPTIWTFDPTTKNYATYSSSTGITTGNGGSIIESGQGFFVQANNNLGLSPTLVFQESAKTVTQAVGANLLLGTPVSQTAYNSYLRLKLITDTINYDDTVIGFNSTSTAKFNSFEDSAFLPGSGGLESISVMSGDSVKASVKWLPLPKNNLKRVIKLNVIVAASGLYTLERTDFKEIPAIYRVWLMDNYKKDSLDIRHNTTYAFNVSINDTASYGSNRFRVAVLEDPALGLHLLDFTATKVTGGSEIVWKTENEQNYTYFTVERSTNNGINFDVMNGLTSSNLGTYSYLDKAPLTGNNLYRLKLVDLNGSVTYSKVVTLRYDNASSLANISVYPNPAKNTLNLTINQVLNASSTSLQAVSSVTPLAATFNTVYSIKIVNNTGTVIKTTTTTQLDWQTDVSNLLPGTYIIQVINDQDKSLVGRAEFVKM